MFETPSVPVPVPVSNNSTVVYSQETKCSYNAFDPSSPPHSNDFLRKLNKRINSFDKMTLAYHDTGYVEDNRLRKLSSK